MTDELPPYFHQIPGAFRLADLPQGAQSATSAVSTGWQELDTILKIYPTQFIVCTGYAGSGKSTFLFNLIINLCWKHQWKAWMYVPENELFLHRKLQAMFNGHTPEFKLFSHKHCFVQSSNYEHYMDEPRDIEWILGNAYAAHQKEKLNVVMIDPWNELERAKARDENLTDYIGRCLMRVKLFAKTTGCTVIMVAHPTKAAAGKEPSLVDIEGSMHWFNKCDTGLIIKHSPGDKDTTVISAKVRERPYGGELGRCVMLFDKETGIFREQKGGGQVL